MVICLERDADLHMAQLMPLPLTVSCFSIIQIGFTFLVPAHPGSPGKMAVKRVCVCVYTDCPIIRQSFCTSHKKFSRKNRQWQQQGLTTSAAKQPTAAAADIIHSSKFVLHRLISHSVLWHLTQGHAAVNDKQHANKVTAVSLYSFPKRISAFNC